MRCQSYCRGCTARVPITVSYDMAKTKLKIIIKWRWQHKTELDGDKYV